MSELIKVIDDSVIRASAGAGKTFQLSSRYLQLLAYHASPDSILATTFTRKAAGEILERIMQRLAYAALDDDDAMKLGEQLKLTLRDAASYRPMLSTLADALHRVKVSTIDAFFAGLGRCFQYELQLPAEPRMASPGDAVARAIRMEAIDGLLAEGEPDTLISLLRRLHHDNVQRSVTDAIDDIVSSLHVVYQQATRDAWHALEPPKQLDETQLVDAIAFLQGCGQGLAKGLAKAWEKDLHQAMAQDWTAFLDTGIAAKIAVGETTFGRSEIPSAVVDAYRPLVIHAKAHAVSVAAYRARAIHELLDRFDKHDRALREERGIVLFSDVPHRIAELMRGHDRAEGDDTLPQLLNDIYYRLDGRIHHLLLDEFQDTSVEQWQVLRPMAQEIRAQSVDAAGGGRSFFCVGDVKQAIYHWRGGTAEIFKQVEDDLHLDPEAAMSLPTSRRSAPAIMATVNRVFDGITECEPLKDVRPAVTQWHEGFDQQQAFNEKQPGYVQVIASPFADGDEDRGGEEADGGEDMQDVSAASPHEQFVVDKVAALVQAHPGLSIGVLTLKNDMVRRLLFGMLSRGLHASGESGNPVTDDPAVGAVISALLLADHPRHTAAAYHVLNSPLGEVLGLKSTRPGSTVAVSTRLRARLIDEGYAAVLSEWTQRLAASCSERNVMRLTQLIQLADAFDPQSTLRSRDFIDYVEATAVEDPMHADIRVMTIHKSKGLEFDVVVLPQLDALIGDVRRQEVWTWRAHPLAPPQAVFAKLRQKELDSIREHYPQVLEAYEQEQALRVHDDLSLLYVAMTRARHALHMVLPPVQPKKSGAPGSTHFSNRSFAALLRHQLTDLEDPFTSKALYEQGDRDWFAALGSTEPPAPAMDREVLRIAVKQDADARRTWRQLSPSGMEGGGRIAIRDLVTPRAQEHLQFGSIMHAWLEQVAWLDGGDGIPADELLIDVARERFGELQPLALQAMLDRFHEMLAQPGFAGLLSRPSTGEPAADEQLELWRERPFIVRTDDGLMRGSFDRVVLHRSPPRLRPTHARIIDFKTDQIGEPDLPERIAHYQPQLDAYRRALAAITMLPLDSVHATLAFVAIDRMVDIHQGSP